MDKSLILQLCQKVRSDRNAFASVISKMTKNSAIFHNGSVGHMTRPLFVQLFMVNSRCSFKRLAVLMQPFRHMLHLSEKFQYGFQHECLPAFIARMVDEGSRTVFELYEWTEGISLYDYLRSRQNLEEKAYMYFLISSQLQSLASKLSSENYCHRDIWEKNIVLMRNSGRIRIIDSSTSISLSDTPDVDNIYTGKMLFNNDQKAISRLEGLMLAEISKCTVVEKNRDVEASLEKALTSIESGIKDCPGINASKLIFSGGLVLAALGIRYANDIDFTGLDPFVGIFLMALILITNIWIYWE